MSGAQSSSTVRYKSRGDRFLLKQVVDVEGEKAKRKGSTKVLTTDDVVRSDREVRARRLGGRPAHRGQFF